MEWDGEAEQDTGACMNEETLCRADERQGVDPAVFDLNMLASDVF